VTSLQHASPIFISTPREQSNTSKDFLDFVYSAVATGCLLAGDVFIVDNARVHWAADTANELSRLLEEANVRLVFTPTYSPELNPCEFVFAQVKRFLRERTDWTHQSFLSGVMNAFATVTHSNVAHYYDSCIHMRAQ